MIIIHLYVVVSWGDFASNIKSGVRVLSHGRTCSWAAYASDIESGVWALSYVCACSCVVFVSDIRRGCSVICDEIAYKCKKG